LTIDVWEAHIPFSILRCSGESRGTKFQYILFCMELGTLRLRTKSTTLSKLHQHEKWRRAEDFEVVGLLAVVDGEEEEALAIAEV